MDDMMSVRVTSNGRIVIPVSLRRKHGIDRGTKIVFFDNGDDIVLRPITHQRITSLRGTLKGKGALDILLEERQKDKMRE
jgi:AbrB family looped-hinge helix DNA binding protein